MRIEPLTTLLSENTKNGIYKSKEFMGAGIPIVKMSQQFGNRFIDSQLNGYELITLDDKEIENYSLQENDLLFSRTSVVPEGVGMCSIIREKERSLVFESNIIRVRLDRKLVNPEFVFRYFQSPMGRGNVLSIAGGTNIKTIKASSLKELRIPLINRESQDRVVEVLRNYDDLIENNRRRIQLLEESARLLYQEWFIHLRFPGHEQVAISEGVPVGWEKKPIKQIATFNYGKALKAEIRIPGPYPVYGSSGEVGNHEKALVNGPAIVVGRKGNVGSIYWVNTDFYPIDTVYFINKDESDLFLYHALQNVQFINTDVAVPGLNRDMAYSREILIPDKKNYQRFLDEVQPIQDQINTLQNYNNKLAHARDLLLPKLMSGELTI